MGGLWHGFLELEHLPGGGSRIGHPRRPGASDDFADVIAMAAMEVVRGKGTRQFDPRTMIVGSAGYFGASYLSPAYGDGYSRPFEDDDSPDPNGNGDAAMGSVGAFSRGENEDSDAWGSTIEVTRDAAGKAWVRLR